MMLPGFRLRHLGADIEREQSGNSAEPKHWSPAPGRKSEAVRNRGKQISHRVAILQNAAQHAAPAAGSRLHHQRRAYAPFAAHADAVENAQNEEDRVVRREAAEKLNHREENDVSNQRNAAAVAVRQETKNHRAHRTHEQRPGDGGDDVSFADVKLCRERVEEENDDKEIERVQRPAEKSGGYCMELRSAAGVRCGSHWEFVGQVCARAEPVSTYSRRSDRPSERQVESTC